MLSTAVRKVRVFGLPQVGAESHRGAGGIPRVQQSQAEGGERANDHQAAVGEYHVQVAGHDAFVDDLRHQHRDGEFERGLRRHAQQRKQEVAAVGSKVLGDQTDAVHRVASRSSAARRLARTRVR